LFAIRFGCKHETNKNIFLFCDCLKHYQTDFVIGLNGEHSSPLQINRYFHHIKKYMFKLKFHQSGRPMNAPADNKQFSSKSYVIIIQYKLNFEKKIICQRHGFCE